MTDQLQIVEIVKIAKTITQTEQEILYTLKKRGPGLLIEVATRVCALPEDVARIVKEMEKNDLIEIVFFGGTPLGDGMLCISEKGVKVLEIIDAVRRSNENIYSILEEKASHEVSGPDPENKVGDSDKPSISEIEQEAVRLQKIGDLALENGDLEKAGEYYLGALNLLRSIPAKKGKRMA